MSSLQPADAEEVLVDTLDGIGLRPPFRVVVPKRFMVRTDCNIDIILGITLAPRTRDIDERLIVWCLR